MRMPFFALAFGVAIAAAAPASAFDSSNSVTPSELAAIRTKIKAKDYKTAISELYRMVNAGIEDADVFNLLGFSLRKDGDRERAMIYYKKALAMNPNHKGALEYQGELFLMIGDPASAKANLARLEALCPTGCEEREDLEEAIKQNAGKG